MANYYHHVNGGGRVREGVVVPESVHVGPSATIYDGTIYDGTIYGGEIHGGTILGGEIYGGTIYGGTIYGGEIHGGEIYGGTIYGGEIYGGTIRGGEIRGGEIWGGTIYDGVYRNDSYTPIGVTDAGYFVSANYENGEWRIEAGCRDFPTIEEAIEHWSAPDYHTPRSGRRIVAALQALAAEEIK